MVATLAALLALATCVFTGGCDEYDGLDYFVRYEVVDYIPRSGIYSQPRSGDCYFILRTFDREMTIDTFTFTVLDHQDVDVTEDFKFGFPTFLWVLEGTEVARPYGPSGLNPMKFWQPMVVPEFTQVMLAFQVVPRNGTGGGTFKAVISFSDVDRVTYQQISLPFSVGEDDPLARSAADYLARHES